MCPGGGVTAPAQGQLRLLYPRCEAQVQLNILSVKLTIEMSGRGLGTVIRPSICLLVCQEGMHTGPTCMCEAHLTMS